MFCHHGHNWMDEKRHQDRDDKWINIRKNVFYGKIETKAYDDDETDS